MVARGPYIEYIPVWLGPLVFSLGVVVIIIGIYAQPWYENPDIVDRQPGQAKSWRLAIWGFILFTLTMIGIAFLEVMWLFVLSISIIGRYIEGVAMGRTSIWLSSNQQPSNWFHRLLGIATVFWVVMLAMSLGAFPAIMSRELLILWTVFALLSTIIGFSIKIKPATQVLPSAAFAGFVLCVAGTEIFNLSRSIWVLDIVAGYLAFLYGANRTSAPTY